MSTTTISSDTSDFLEALLWVASGQRPHVANWSVYEFHPEFIGAVEGFIDGFRAYLENLDDKHPETDIYSDPDAGNRSFGGNVYLSLSGSGCGFFDEPDGDFAQAMQSALEDYSGDGSRFEEIDCMLAKSGGRIHFGGLTAKFRREFTKRLVWRGPDGDSRYSIWLEGNGNERPQWVLRWCGDYIAGYDSIDDAFIRANEHRAQRMGEIETTSNPTQP